MSSKERIARRVAQELKDGDRVHLGIGLPTLVAAYVPKDIDVFFHSENGIVGMSPLPGEGFEDRNLTDAGGRPGGIEDRAAMHAADHRHAVRGSGGDGSGGDQASGGAAGAG